MIVIDASALLDALVRSDGHGDRARDRLERDLDHHAPHIVKAEALSGLRKLTAAGEVAERQGSPLIRQIMDLNIDTYPIEGFIPRIWGLRANLTVYDAWYVALAEALEIPLVTTDHRIPGAPGITCDVELID